MPRVSIITAVRCDTVDKREWFKELAASVLEQDMEDWEWVVVDDESEHPPEAPPDVRVVLVRASRRQGPAACRNTAARIAKAEALLPVDGDDRLPFPSTLSTFLAAYDPRLFVYGDLQMLEGGQPGRVIRFPPYSFEKSMEFIGNVPVTALHSRECWRAAGGWKTRFDAGLEDLEYWISAGKAGFCGRHMEAVTLLYRKHPQSRAQRMRQDFRQKEMEAAIRAYHKDLYEEGVFPMGCCGGGKGGGKAPSSTKTLPIRAARPEYNVTGGEVWVRYNGRRDGGFYVLGETTRKTYEVNGIGDEFPIAPQDANGFRKLGRGRDFTIGIPAPQPAQAAAAQPAAAPAQPAAYRPPEPELAEIVRLPGTPVEPEPTPEPELEPEPRKLLAALTMAGVRDGERVRELLEKEGWAVDMLAQAEPEDLVQYKGIGESAASKIIAEAKRLAS